MKITGSERKWGRSPGSSRIKESIVSMISPRISRASTVTKISPRAGSASGGCLPAMGSNIDELGLSETASGAGSPEANRHIHLFACLVGKKELDSCVGYEDLIPGGPVTKGVLRRFARINLCI